METSSIKSAKPKNSKFVNALNLTKDIIRAIDIEDEASHVLITEVGSKRVLQMNRPKMRNAMGSYMIKKLRQCFEEWQQDPRVQLIIVKGNDKSFSSGGEIKCVAGFGEHVDHLVNFNYAIHNFKKPYIALVNGMAMGGGLGLAIKAKFMIATERAFIAMPEATVGYYPDAGSAHFLKGNFGLFMALTGYRLKGADIYHAGLASHYVKSTNLPALEQALLSISEDSHCIQSIQKIIDFYQEKSIPKFTLAPYLSEIDQHFSKNSVEDVMKSLESSNSEFAQLVLEGMKRISSLSLKVTFRHFKNAKNLNFDELMTLEHSLTRRFVKEYNFYEGVRAMLLDKDYSPKWKPGRLEDVTQAMVDSFFQKNDQKSILTSKL